MIRTTHGFYVSTTGGIYETSKKEVEPDSLNQNGTAKPWVRWGTDNNYPQRLIDVVGADPAASLLEKRRAMHWGRGLMYYKRRIEKGKEIIDPVDDSQIPSEIDDFMYLIDAPNFFQGCIADFEWWHSYCIEYICSNDGKIINAKWQRMKDVRAELRDRSTGDIENYYLSGHWPNPQEGYYLKVPSFKKDANRSGLYRHQLVSVDKDYNPQPAWHGITRWLHIAAKIPRWILANIDNSINLKWHVEIPLDYFLKRHPVEAYATAEERNKAIQDDEKDVYKNIDAYLAGETNVGKAFYSKVAVDDSGKELPGWKITPLSNDIKDSAWLNAYGTAAMAITSGIGLSPSIGGQILPNGLGSGSGSDLREQFNFYMQVMTAQPRQTTLEPWEIFKRRNGWPKDLHLGYRDVVLQSTDQNKSGYATQNEQSPTTDKGDNNKTQP